MKIGDHLISPRTAYSHHGLYVGDGNVIHYTGFAKTKVDGVIAITSLREFCQGRSVRIKHHKTRIFSHEKSIGRAKTRLGENWYNVLLNNCEHFVTWCIYGLPISRQVNNVILGTIGYKVFTQTATKKMMASIPLNTAISTIAQGKRTTDIARFAISASSCTFIRGSTASGLATVGSGLGGCATSGILAGAASIASPLAPLAAAIAIGYLVDYGIRQLFD